MRAEVDIEVEAAIRRFLSATADAQIGPIEIHDELDSTNTRLMSLAATGNP